MLIVWVLVFLLGTAVGSFLNVVVYRVLHGDSPFRGRSECPGCKRVISWYDNIPLVSFVLLGGKCRRCGKKISLQYPVLELLTGVLFVWWYGIGQIFFRLSEGPYQVIQPGFWLLIGIALASLLVADLFYGMLPDIFTMGISVIAFLYRFALTVTGIMKLYDFLLFVTAGVVASGFFMGLAIVTKGKGMGMGDVKLALAMGLLLGWPKTLVAMVVAFLTGATLGIILIVAKQKRFGQTIPFGPFMILGTVVALAWGEVLWHQYTAMLGL